MIEQGYVESTHLNKDENGRVTGITLNMVLTENDMRNLKSSIDMFQKQIEKYNENNQTGD